jgi:hypothetical protein
MSKKIEFRQVRDFGEIINDTFVFLGQNWKQILKAYALICGFFIIASMVVSILNQIKATDTINPSTAPYSFSRYHFGVEYFLSMLFLIISYATITLTIFAYIALYVEKGNTAPSTEEIWGYVKFYFWRVFWSSLLLGLGLVVAFLLCLLPGFYIWPAFSLIIPIIIFENATLGFAYTRAFQLIKDNYWATLGVLLISVIIVYAGIMVFALPVTIITTGSMLITGHKITTTYLIVNAIITHICMVFYIIPYVAMAFTYFSLTEQKDGTGLLSRIDQLGTSELGNDQLPTEEY